MPKATMFPSIERFGISTAGEDEAMRLGIQLRRFLLSEVEGMAATAIRIEGAIHEFQAIPGVREDALDVIGNLKELRIRAEGDAIRAKLDSASTQVKAGELSLDSGEVVNPDLVLAHLSAGVRLRAEIIFERGRSFRALGDTPEGFLPVPARFCPVEKVGVKVEGGELLVTVETDASVAPESAMRQAAGEMGFAYSASEVGPHDSPPDLELGPEFHGDPFMGVPPAFRDPNRESYAAFLEIGIPRLLETLFPLASQGHSDEAATDAYWRKHEKCRRLDLIGHRLQMPDKTPDQCAAEGLTYEARLFVTLRIKRGVADGIYGTDDPLALVEREVDLGPIPLMVDDGRFMFNGERMTCIMLMDREGKAVRIGDLATREMESLITRMKPVLEERVESAGWLDANILDLLPLSATLNGLIGSADWCQWSDETNPLALLTHRNRLSTLGVARGGSEDPELRSIKVDQFGRLDYLETPEGPNCGLIHSLSMYAKIDPDGTIRTPYRRVENGEASDETVYVTSQEEAPRSIADVSAVGSDGRLREEWVTVRCDGSIRRVPKAEVEFVSVSPVQPFGFSAALVPFVGHDDPNRALMGVNMQRQAVAPIRCEQPLVKTGVEARAALDSGQLVVAKRSGKVLEATGERIVVQSGRERDAYELIKYKRSHQAGCLNLRPIVSPGQDVAEGQPLADAAGTIGGEMAIGRNVLVAYMPFRGYNFEDAICISDELVADETFTSISIQKEEVEVGDTEVWVAPVGSRLSRGDVLVQEASGRKRTLLTVPTLNPVVVIESRRRGRWIRLMLAEKRHASIGDKFAGRHGNKGCIARILPRAEMPHMEDGTPVQMILNPLGVVSRMDLGQILEAHYGLLAHTLGTQITVPPFMTPPHELLKRKLAEAGLSETGMMTLYDGATGRAFDSPVTVGWVYMLKLAHMADDKVHAISTERSPLIARQSGQFVGQRIGSLGQRVGRLEMWALEAYNVGSTLQEFLTIKSDDATGRERAAIAMLSGESVEPTGEGESLQLLESALRGLGISVEEERSC